MEVFSVSLVDVVLSDPKNPLPIKDNFNSLFSFDSENITPPTLTEEMYEKCICQETTSKKIPMFVISVPSIGWEWYVCSYLSDELGPATFEGLVDGVYLEYGTVCFTDIVEVVKHFKTDAYYYFTDKTIGELW
jgi:hypothetical protein